MVRTWSTESVTKCAARKRGRVGQQTHKKKKLVSNVERMNIEERQKLSSSVSTHKGRKGSLESEAVWENIVARQCAWQPVCV